MFFEWCDIRKHQELFLLTPLLENRCNMLPLLSSNPCPEGATRNALTITWTSISQDAMGYGG